MFWVDQKASKNKKFNKKCSVYIGSNTVTTKNSSKQHFWCIFFKQAWTFSSALSIFFFIHEENDAGNEVLQSVVSLTKKVKKCESNQRNKKLSVIFLSNDLM